MSEEKKSTKSLTIVVIALLLIIIVGGGAFGAYYLFFSKKDSQVTTLKAPENQVAIVSSKTYCLDEMLLNLADEDGKRYIKLTIYIGYENKKLAPEFEEKKHILRDAVGSILRSKKSKDFSVKGSEEIKQEILNKINPLFTNGKADNIYFSGILVQ